MKALTGEGLADLLGRIKAGDGAAEQQLVALLYRDLRAIAARRMRRQRPDPTWHPTVLVNEAVLRVRIDGSLEATPDKAFLLKAAGKAMHQLLVDHHRTRSRQKRGGRMQRQPIDLALDHVATVAQVAPVELRDELD